jgi:gliding motility-associated-like protein
LQLKITDQGCTKNAPVSKQLDKALDYSLIQSVVQGDKDVCLGGAVELSVKDEYQNKASNFKWERNGNVLSTAATLKIDNASEANSGKYVFSMNWNGCSVTHVDTLNINVGKASVPNVTLAFPCFNSPEISLSKYAAPTSTAYKLIWYQSDNTLIGETAPKFNPNNLGKTKYYVSQKNTTGCESDKVELLVTVEERPAATGANNVIVCGDPSNPDPKIIVVNAGKYKYNLYDAYTGGNKVGSGTAVNDTAHIASQNLVVGKTYYLETENQHGCVSADRTTVSVTVRESLISGNDKICFGSNISLTSDYPGGKITWTKPDNSTVTGKNLTVTNVTFADAGIYSILIEESGLGCTMRDKKQVTVNQPVVPAVSKDSYRYYENETASAMTATAKTGLTLKWYNPSDELILKAGQPDQAPIPATDKTGIWKYHVSQDSLGCESPKVEVTVIVGTIPSPVPAADINICMAEKPVIQISNTTANYTYRVFHNNTEIATGVGNGATISLTCNVVISANTEFEIDVLDTYGVNSERTKKAVVAVNKLVDIQNSSSVICKGSNGSLTAVNITGATYKWTTPANTEFEGQTISITDASSKDAGKYTLSVTTQGCPVAQTTASLSVTQPAVPAVSKDSYRYYENETASAMTATANTGLTLKWYNGANELILKSGQPDQAPVPATDKTGTFTYYVSQDSLGCESPKVTVTVTVGTVPSPVPDADINICIAEKPVIQIGNTIENYTYRVFHNNTEIAKGIGNGATISLTANVAISDNTEFEIDVLDTYNVNSTRVKKPVISINKLIDLQQSSVSLCDGSNGKLVAVSIANAAYKWTTPANIEVDGQTVLISGASSADAGAYALSVTTQGCPAAKQSVQVKVEKPAPPEISQQKYYCVGDNASPLTATSLSGYKLRWFDASNTQLPDAPTPSTSNAGKTVYYVMQMSQSDENCFSDKDSIAVIVENKPDAVVLAPVSICAANETNYTDEVNTETKSNTSYVNIPNSIEGYTYSLYGQASGGEPAGKATGNGASVKIAINDPITSNVTYYLQVENKAGCSSERTPVELILVTINLLTEELPPYQINEFYSQQLKTNISDVTFSLKEGYLPNGFRLSGDGNIAGTASSYDEPAIFTVEVATGSGCSITKDYTLKSELIVAKMFSPNGDGINDVFMKGYRLIIFDRYGRKLFSGENGWDGTYNGRIMPEDVYYYTIYYKDKDGTDKKLSSYITLVKN